jgi:uncharacterized membrane protein
MLYLIFKLLHVAAVILFLGNIITGLFWKFHADRTRNLHVIEHTLVGIIRSDRWFTIPGVVAILIAGFGAAIIGRIPILGTGWILWSIVLFSLSGLAFSLRVAPLQTKLATLARAGVESGEFDWARYHSLSRAWELWGLFALLTPVAAVVLMVLKPILPAF